MKNEKVNIQRRHFIGGAMSVAAMTAFPKVLNANSLDNYPKQPITIVVPFAPGGGADITTRIVSQELTKRLDANIIIVHRPGAGTQIANSSVARARPDGYTLLLGVTNLIQAPGLYKELPYDVFEDFAPIAQLATTASTFTVPASSGITTFAEFMEYAKAKKGTLNYGSTGNGITTHLHGAQFNSMLDLDMVHVPYAGTAPLINALLGDQVECAFVDISPLKPHVEAGKLNVLACTGPNRTLLFPDVPTLAELGVQGFESVAWFSLFGPAGMPQPAVELLSEHIQEVLKMDSVKGRLHELGLVPSALNRQEFAQSMVDDMPKWAAMIKAGNISIE